MSDPDKAEFQKKLDELSDRLRARIEEFRQKGGFSDVHGALMNQIQQRNDALRKKVADTQSKGTAWELMKAEFARDYSSLFDDVLEFEERLDAEGMKQRKG